MPETFFWTLTLDLSFRYDLDIVIANIDGSEPRLLTINKARDEFPVWSPDGSQIAFFSFGQTYPHMPVRTTPSGVYLVASDGPGEGSVVGPAEGIPRPPVWSPDSTRIAYITIENEYRNTVLYTVSLDGSQPTRVSDTVSEPAWSPDGEHLALAKLHGDDVVLFIMNADGSDCTDDRNDNQPRDLREQP